MHEEKGKNRILLLESHRIVWGENRFHIRNTAPSPLHVKLCWHSGTEWHQPFLQNNNNKPKSNLTTDTTPIGVTNVQGPSPASFPTVLFITFPSLTYSPQLLLPSSLLSAWNRHSRKYILCKLSSCCYSWFHKWWWNGQESERGKWKKMAVARYDHIPPLSFFIDNRGWLENSRWEGQH